MGEIVHTINGEEVKARRTAITKAQVRLSKHKPMLIFFFLANLLIIPRPNKGSMKLYEVAGRSLFCGFIFN